MLILFMGPTASGKTTLMNSLRWEHVRFKPVLRITSRPKRLAEVSGYDYDFVAPDVFEELIKRDVLAEYECYSDKRYYGTTKDALIAKGLEILCSTITPSGLLQIANSDLVLDKVYLFVCECSLANQIIRYVSRTPNFSVSDKLEMCDRLARDEGMFKGIEAQLIAASSLFKEKGTDFNFTFIDMNQPEEDCLSVANLYVSNYIK